jgi:AraC-like DNA-binding protein
VNEYASYAGTVETHRRQQEALDRLRPLFRYLGENYGKALHVCEAARVCGMSESYFMSFFKHVTGLSFTRYLNQFRIEQAQSLLANSDESMASIGQHVGFCDQSHFGMVFKKISGMTPASYRRRYRNTAGNTEPLSRSMVLSPLTINPRSFQPQYVKHAHVALRGQRR